MPNWALVVTFDFTPGTTIKSENVKSFKRVACAIGAAYTIYRVAYIRHSRYNRNKNGMTKIVLPSALSSIKFTLVSCSLFNRIAKKKEFKFICLSTIPLAQPRLARRRVIWFYWQLMIKCRPLVAHTETARLLCKVLALRDRQAIMSWAMLSIDQLGRHVIHIWNRMSSNHRQQPIIGMT